MKAAGTEAEFRKRLKEGKPFELKPKSAITIAKLPGAGAPLMQIFGTGDEVNQMLIFAVSEVSEAMLAAGNKKEQVKEFWTGAVEMAVELADENDPEKRKEKEISVEKIEIACKEVLKITEEELKEMEKIAQQQMEYFNPLKMETAGWQHELGQHNKRVVKKIRELKETLEAGANIKQP